MGRILVFVYGAISYVVFFVTFLYAIGFVGNLVVPKSIDTGPPAATLTRALVMNLILMTIFAVQHSVMARPAFKRWWTRIVPPAIERSTYVLLASLTLLLLFWQWRPITDVVWEINNTAGQYVLWAIFFAGWGMVLLSTFLINHFDLFGLRQVYLYQKGVDYTEVGFKELLLYKIVRHPLLLGFIIAFWATPRMTAGHLLFAVVTTVYMLVAIQLEERDSLRAHGEAYEDYRKRVPMLVPIPKRRDSETTAVQSG